MHDAIGRLRDNITRVYLGHRSTVDRVVCCLLARGHLLIEDVPGVGKTLLATAMARSLGLVFTRIQLTPDLLPSDLLGVSIYQRESGDFIFKRGPIFANVILADEINRATPRTQSALLEAMGEASVSVDGRTLPLDQPFFVVATQNPVAFEGTYQLPENQLDRFLMRVRLGYPDPADEARVLDQRPAARPLHELSPVLEKSELLDLQDRTDSVKIDPALLNYIVAFANASRRHEELALGLSPRGSLALAQTARATALFNGREYVVPEDITSNIHCVCAHRVIVRAAAGHAEDAERILDTVLRSVPSPA